MRFLVVAIDRIVPTAEIELEKIARGCPKDSDADGAVGVRQVRGFYAERTESVVHRGLLRRTQTFDQIRPAGYVETYRSVPPDFAALARREEIGKLEELFSKSHLRMTFRMTRPANLRTARTRWDSGVLAILESQSPPTTLPRICEY